MKFSSLHNIISIHPYEVVSGKVPSKANLQAFFKEKQFPQRVNGWRFGFMDVEDRIKYRNATNFFAEVVTNLSGVKILRDEVKKMSVPQKHLEMIAAAFHKNGILEIIGSRPYTSNLLFSLLKNKFDLTLKPLKTDSKTINRLFKSSVVVRKLVARTEIDGQNVFVGLRSPKNLENGIMSSLVKKKPQLTAVGGQIQLSSGNLVSYSASNSGSNVLYSSSKTRIGWREITDFMDSYIYPEKQV